MRISSKGRLLSKEQIWFESHSVTPKSACDVITLFGNDKPITGEKNTKQYSLVNDLSLGLDSLMLSKTVKNEINRSQRENVIVKQLNSAQLKSSRSVLQDYGEMYHGMYESKGMPNEHLNIHDVEMYLSADCFLLTIAYIDNEPMVYHGYIYGDGHCRLLHSCSNFRINDKEVRNAIGRANKYLHWEDMRYFLEYGIASYDWGGVSSLDEPSGIDKFKMAFGGQPVEYYNITINNSIKARLLKAIYKLKERNRK